MIKPLAKLVDELGAIEREMEKAEEAAAVEAAKLDEKRARAGLLTKTILALYEKKPATVEYAVGGDSFDAIVTKREIRREMASTAVLFERLGQKRYVAASSVTLAALDKVATSPEWAALVTEKRTGPRSLRLVEKKVTS